MNKIMKEFLTINKYSRPGTKIRRIEKIVLHWVWNAGSKGINNRHYFENLKSQIENNGYLVNKDGTYLTDKNGNRIKPRYASSHYIIGLDGEIIAPVPEDEVAYHAGMANNNSIGIEFCHPNDSGEPNPLTYESLVNLLSDLCKRYSLNPMTDIIRHYDVTGKDCPRYYVNNLMAFGVLKREVEHNMNKTIEVAVQTVSVWAKTAWEWAKEKKFLDGTRPKDGVTREEMAVILERVYKDLNK